MSATAIAVVTPELALFFQGLWRVRLSQLLIFTALILPFLGPELGSFGAEGRFEGRRQAFPGVC